MRLADEIDAGQARGEVEGHGGARNFKVRTPDVELPTADELGVSRQRIHEMREVRDAGPCQEGDGGDGAGERSGKVSPPSRGLKPSISRTSFGSRMRESTAI